MEILFLASMSVIVADAPASRGLFVDALGLPLQPDASEWKYSPEACFGSPVWPADRPVPQASVEFEVRDAAAVADAERELGTTGRVLLRSSGTEPLVRVMVEAADIEQARAVAQRLADVVKSALG